MQRYSLETEADGHSLVVTNVEPGDAGEYTCHVSAYQLTEVTTAMDKFQRFKTLLTKPLLC